MEEEKLSVALGFGTSIGRVREVNEDSFCVFTPYPGSEDTSEFLAVLGVADGMGGHKAGDVASSFLVQRLNAAFVEGKYKERYGHLTDLGLILKNLIRDLNQELFLLSKKDKIPGQMGSTLTFGLIKNNQIWIAHVGDSRCYVICGGKIEQLTKDHSWVAEQLRFGVLTKEEAVGHPQNNIVTQAMGIDPNIEPQVLVREIKSGEQYLFCTDGLIRHVSDQEILECLNSNSHPQRACDYLIDLANQRGGEDNITLVLISIGRAMSSTIKEEAAWPEEATKKSSPWSKTKRLVAMGMAGLCLTTGSFLVGSFYQKSRLAKKVNEFLIQGRSYLEAGELDKAALLTQSVLKLDKKNKAARELMNKIIYEEERRKNE